MLKKITIKTLFFFTVSVVRIVVRQTIRCSNYSYLLQTMVMDERII